MSGDPDAPADAPPPEERAAGGLFTGPIVRRDSADPVDDAPIDPVFLAIRSIAEPMAAAQKVESQEKTKRAQIEARAGTDQNTANVGLAKHNARVAIVGLGMLMVFLLILVGLGQVALAEKIGIAVVGFLGGVGYGRGMKKTDD